MARRIDALYCGSEDAEQMVSELINQIRGRAQRASQEVSTAIGERVAALQERQSELLAQVDRAARTKEQALERQLRAILEGNCPPALAEAGAEQDPNRFLLAADPILTFSIGSHDFLEALPQFGVVGQASTYASLSTAKGPALGVMKAGNPSFLWVTASDREGARRAEGGDRVLASISSPQDFGDLAVDDLKDGRYRINFVPLAPGDFSLRVSIYTEDGIEEDIQGSPFDLVVRPPTEYQHIGAEMDGKAKIEGLVGHPCGVDFDNTGRFIFVADQTQNQVRVIDSETHEQLHSFGKAGRGAGAFDTPCDLVVDPDNRVLVSDLLNHRIQILQFWPRSMELTHVTTFGFPGQGEGQFHFPKGVGLTEHGQLLVCDSGNHRVQMFDLHDNCRFVQAWGTLGTGDGQFTSPLAVTCNRNGEILVSDASNRIQVFDAQGGFVRAFGGKSSRADGCFNYPVALSVNDENALFVCDQGNHRIQVLSAIDGAFMHKWQGKKVPPAAGAEGGEDPTSDAEGDPSRTTEWTGLRSPAGVAVTPAAKSW